MHFLASNMRKRNLLEVAVEAEVDVAVVVAVEVLMIMGVLRSKTVKVLTSTSTSLKSITWCMKSIRNLCPKFIHTIMKIPEEEEAVVEVEVDVVVVVVIIMTRRHRIPDLKQRLSKN
jgi:hypothetical protein